MPKIRSREKTKEQLKEELRKTKEEVAIQKWGIEKTLKGMKTLVKEIIQKKKEIEEAKIKAETSAKDLEKFKLALDNTSEQVVIADPEGIVIYANRAVEKITGYMPEEAIGKKSGALWKSPMSLKYYQKMWSAIKEQKKVFLGEILNRRKNGDLYTAAISITPVLNKKGEVKFFVSIERDITEYKEAQKVLMKEELRKEEIRKLKELDKIKTQFLSVTSHELRSPMTPMKAQLQMMMQGYFGKINKKQKEAINIVASNTDRLDRLIQDLLEVSRIEAGRLKFNLVRTDLVKEFKTVAKEMKAFLPEKNIKLVLNIGKLPIIKTDPDKVIEVLRNLINNAIKFSPNGSKVFAAAELKNKTIQFSVMDKGIGISPESQKRIFEPFFQTEQTMSRKYGGTGLGLSICKGIVEAQNGKIWFESEKGKGSTFYFTVPLKPVKQV